MSRPPKKEKLSSLFLQGLRFKILLARFRNAVRTAGPQPWAPDHSGHCRASTESSRSQRALPDLNRELQISAGTAGPQRRTPDHSGHRRTSTASSRSQRALPDLNRELQISASTAGPQPRAPDLSGNCRTSTANSRSQWALPDLPDLTQKMSKTTVHRSFLISIITV